MKVLAVAATYKAADLTEADFVVSSLQELTIMQLESLFDEAGDYRRGGAERKGGSG